MSNLEQPKIAVVGAGPGGLVAARILQMHGISAKVFERDSSADARAQGGVLDMHVRGGQFAFRACGLYDEFLKIARYDEQEMILYDKAGTLRFFEPTQPGADRPETDRPDIRRVLLASVEPKSIRWEHVLVGIDQAAPAEPVTLHFRNAPSETFDLVIGADGAWSRVRTLVSTAEVAYTGVTFYELHYTEEAAHDPELVALARRGNMFAKGDRRGINAHRTASGGMHVYAGMWTGETPGPPMTSEELLKYFETWSPNLQRFLTLAESRTSLRVISELPIAHRWPHRAGITLIGDAAHLMSPFSGEGANLAMRDATDLACAIVGAVQNGADWNEAISGFESVMWERAEAAAVGAAEGVRRAFGRLHGCFRATAARPA